MEILGNGEWARLKSALDAARSGTGRPMAEERKKVEAIVWRQRNRAKWRARSSKLRPWWRAAQLHIRWSRGGRSAPSRLRDAGPAELGEIFLDGTNVRTHKAASAKRGAAAHALGRSRGGYGTKVCTVCDAQG